MARSVRNWHDAEALVLCLMERELPECPELDVFDLVIRASELPFEDFDRLIFRYSLLEAATAIKASLLKWVFNRYGEENHVIFLDPDIWVFSPFIEVIQELSQSAILVTPHHVVDEKALDAIQDNMYRTLRCGIFNAGFLGLNRSIETSSFLDWWEDKLLSQCYMDFTCGLYLDQKWLDMAMSFYDLTVLRHPGYNVANWNISQRPISKKSDGSYVAANMPMRFFHFSGINTGRDQRWILKYAAPQDEIHAIRRQYKEAIASIDHSGFWRIDWSFDRFHSGELIQPKTRLACRHNLELLQRFPSPYDESNESFLAIG
jgi:hypothetical protein